MTMLDFLGMGSAYTISRLGAMLSPFFKVHVHQIPLFEGIRFSLRGKCGAFGHLIHIADS